MHSGKCQLPSCVSWFHAQPYDQTQIKNWTKQHANEPTKTKLKCRSTGNTKLRHYNLSQNSDSGV